MTVLLKRAGEALYGSRWQAEIAEALNISDRTIRRMVAGDSPVPPGVYRDLLKLTQERALALTALADDLTRAGTP